MIRFFLLALALTIGCNTGTVSAQGLTDRVAARRALRQQAEPEKSITQLRQIRQSRLGTQTASVPANATSSLELRREQRRTQRLNNEPLAIKIALIDAVNMERAKMGLSALRLNMLLGKSAQAHAQDMKKRDFFAHVNPDGLHSQQRIKATGYGVINAQKCHCHYAAYFGENLAKGQRTIEEVVKDWMASPPHREAILERNFTEIGVGIVDAFWVLNFGGIEITRANN